MNLKKPARCSPLTTFSKVTALQQSVQPHAHASGVSLRSVSFVDVVSEFVWPFSPRHEVFAPLSVEMESFVPVWAPQELEPRTRSHPMRHQWDVIRIRKSWNNFECFQKRPKVSTCDISFYNLTPWCSCKNRPLLQVLQSFRVSRTTPSMLFQPTVCTKSRADTALFSWRKPCR